MHSALRHVLLSSCVCLACAQSLFDNAVAEQGARMPPQTEPAPRSRSAWLTDQTQYVGLGDDKGSVIALGDFTCDRYADLLVVPNPLSMRAVQVLSWNHYEYAFERVLASRSSEFQPTFSLDTVPGLSSEATISSAVTFDANGDGLLDVLLSVRISERLHSGILVTGDGTGCLRFDQVLHNLTPGMQIMDANDDMAPDVFFISLSGERVFYINDKAGKFTKHIWKPREDFSTCTPTTPFNSNAFVDINGDCIPDLVITTSCGMEVWFNTGVENRTASRWTVGKEFRKLGGDFSKLSLPQDEYRLMLLDASVWDAGAGDGRASFADFNGDGSIDIGVPNSYRKELRISYNVRNIRRRKKICSTDPSWHFETEVALEDVEIPDTTLGPTRLQSTFRIGDFNFDGKADILLLNADTGTLNLFEARSAHSDTMWFPGSRGLSRLKEQVLFSITGTNRRQLSSNVETMRYERSDENVLETIEDPLGAAFFDLDETGRQDILVPQLHGTRLLWNNFKELEDSLFFKATAVDATHRGWRSITTGGQAFSPLPGTTFKLSYGGRNRRETHVCTQCSQTGFLSLQSCSCIFGITQIANYIEEMAMGGTHGVRTWKNLMPNALAVVWPQRHSSRGVSKWKISYLSKGRDGQMKKIVLVLFTTLVILFFAIVYAHSLEKLEERNNKLDIGYT